MQPANANAKIAVELVLSINHAVAVCLTYFEMDTPSYCCDFCPKAFDKAEQLKQHMVMKHVVKCEDVKPDNIDDAQREGRALISTDEIEILHANVDDDMRVKDETYQCSNDVCHLPQGANPIESDEKIEIVDIKPIDDVIISGGNDTPANCSVSQAFNRTCSPVEQNVPELPAESEIIDADQDDVNLDKSVATQRDNNAIDKCSGDTTATTCSVRHADASVRSNITLPECYVRLERIHVQRCSLNGQCVFKALPTMSSEKGKKTKSGKISSKCDSCGKWFKSNGFLKRHIRLMHPNSNRAAPSKYNNTKRAAPSKYNNTKRAATVSCHLCSKVFTSSGFLNRHRRCQHPDGDSEHTAPKSDVGKRKTVTCDVCKLTFKSIGFLNKHIRRQHKTNEAKDTAATVVKAKLAAAGSANRQSTASRSLGDHLTSDVTPDDKGGKHQWQCNQCDKVYNWKSGLNMHIRLYHKANGVSDDLKNDVTPLHKGGKRQWKCNHCSKVYNIKKFLNMHIRLHRKAYEHKATTEANSQPAAVSSPSRQSTQSASLGDDSTSDVTPVHKEGKLQWKCNHCDKSSKWKQVVYRHIRRHHEASSGVSDDLKNDVTSVFKDGKRQWKCNHCNKMYNVKKFLNMHIRLHRKAYEHKATTEAEAKLAAASSPSRQSTQSASLGDDSTSDVTPVHKEGKLQWKCNHCDKSSKWKQVVYRHIRFHHEASTCSGVSDDLKNDVTPVLKEGKRQWKCNHCDRVYSVGFQCEDATICC